MKRLMTAGLIEFLQNNRNMIEADLFVIDLPNGETIYATSGQWDVTVPEGAGGWSGPQTTFYATQYGRWSRGTITSEASFEMSANTMALTSAPQPATAFPGNPVGILNAALNGLFDASQVTVYTAYFPLGQYGYLAGGTASPTPSFVLAQAASAAEAFSSPATTAGIDTGNASIDLIVVTCNNYDGLASELTLTDTINGSPSGNTWTLVTLDPTAALGQASLPYFYYCYTPNTGVDHVFNLASTGNGCPNLCMMAFTGMPSSGSPEEDEGWFGTGGTNGPVYTAPPNSGAGRGWMFPLNENDLIITAVGIYNSHGDTVSVDSGLTIAGDSRPFTPAGITAAYLIAAAGAISCTGDVSVTGGNTAVISVSDVAPFVGQQTCTGTVVLTSNTAAINVTSSDGFTPGLPVLLAGFTSSPGTLNAVACNVISTSTGVITVAFPVNALTPGTYTGQSGTVSMAVAPTGFSAGCSALNDAPTAIVMSVGSGTITVLSGGITNGAYTNQSAGIIGLPVNPFWTWLSSLANNAAAGMVIFPAGPSGTGPGGLETKFKGTITRIVDINRVHVEFECGDPMYLLNMKVPRRLMQPNCPWSVTDENCTLNAGGVDINGFDMTQAFTLSSGTQYVLFPATPFVQPEGYFSQGVVTCTAGNNAGLSQTVKLHASGELQLLNPWLLPVSVGDTFSVLVGCDHTPTTCTVKFGNFLNFGGAPFVPPSETAV